MRTEQQGGGERWIEKRNVEEEKLKRTGKEDEGGIKDGQEGVRTSIMKTTTRTRTCEGRNERGGGGRRLRRGGAR